MCIKNALTCLQVSFYRPVKAELKRLACAVMQEKHKAPLKVEKINRTSREVFKEKKTKAAVVQLKRTNKG